MKSVASSDGIHLFRKVDTRSYDSYAIGIGVGAMDKREEKGTMSGSVTAEDAIIKRLKKEGSSQRLCDCETSLGDFYAYKNPSIMNSSRRVYSDTFMWKKGGVKFCQQ